MAKRNKERPYFLDAIAYASAPSRQIVSDRMAMLQEEAEHENFPKMLGAISRKLLGELVGQLYLEAHIQRAVNGNK
jgi:hypothetical protein